MTKAITACLVIVGLINFVPIIGVISAKKLEDAYSIGFASNDLIILMRHRALLFGILGGFILYAAFVPAYQSAAMTMAAISMIGYAVLTYIVGDYNESLSKVLIIDVIGIIFLFIATILKYFVRDT